MNTDDPPMNITEYERRLTLTAEQERQERLEKFFEISCPVEFRTPLIQEKIKNKDAFGKVASWKWTFPGICCSGGTNGGKTRAVWFSLRGFLYAKKVKFVSLTARGFTEKYFKYHMEGDPASFWKEIGWGDYDSWEKKLRVPELIFMDDLDKIDMNDRNCGVLFELFDRVYRDHVPCISTTNQNRAWWTSKMGEAFVRRFMDDAQTEVKF
jgi:hypothetical protein